MLKRRCQRVFGVAVMENKTQGETWEKWKLGLRKNPKSNKCGALLSRKWSCAIEIKGEMNQYGVMFVRISQFLYLGNAMFSVCLHTP